MWPRAALCIVSSTLLAVACRRPPHTVADAFFCRGLGPAPLDATVTLSARDGDAPWGSLSVRVIDAERPAVPLNGTVVDIFIAPLPKGQEPLRLATTDSAGRVALDSLPPGLYTIRVRSIGYRPVSGIVTVRAGATDSLVVRQPRDLSC